MRYNIYCDEASTTQARYMLIGGLWVPQETEPGIREALRQVRSKHNLTAEMKWTKVSRSKLSAYQDFVDVFFDTPRLAFNCILVDTHMLDYNAYHGGDEELGFYKFYFQLVSHKLWNGNLYWLFTDERSTRKPYRLSVLKLVVNRWCRGHRGANTDLLRAVEPKCSTNEDLIQVADILLGATAYAWNERGNSPAKVALATHLANRLGWESLRMETLPSAFKFNIWYWRPRGQSAGENKMRPGS